jgi:transcriptional pleiotropic regulator of transition state genes
MKTFGEEENAMKSTGIVRKVDELGRVVIPIELRRTLGINEKDALEIYVDDDRIVLKKYKASMTCQVTGEVSDDNLILANGKLILSKEGAERILDELRDFLAKAQ